MLLCFFINNDYSHSQYDAVAVPHVGNYCTIFSKDERLRSTLLVEQVVHNHEQNSIDVYLKALEQ